MSAGGKFLEEARDMLLGPRPLPERPAVEPDPVETVEPAKIIMMLRGDEPYSLEWSSEDAVLTLTPLDGGEASHLGVGNDGADLLSIAVMGFKLTGAFDPPIHATYGPEGNLPFLSACNSATLPPQPRRF